MWPDWVSTFNLGILEGHCNQLSYLAKDDPGVFQTAVSVLGLRKSAA